MFLKKINNKGGIMKTITCQEMRNMDSYAINYIGIPSIVLMENAALKVVKNINLKKNNNFTIVCGTGNNGGDGLAVARHLILIGKIVDIFIIGNIDNGTKDFKINLNIFKNMDIAFINIKEIQDLDLLKKSLNRNDLTIDAIFGTGLGRKVEGLYYDLIDLMNNYSKEIISVDIPSGLDGDSGEPLGISIKANKTVTFHLMKKGLVNKKEYTGKVIVEDIGIPVKEL